MEKLCWGCRYYSAYYTKGKDRFVRKKFGYCHKLYIPVTDHEICPSWKEIEQTKKVNTSSLIKVLDKALNSINEIKQILTENKEEN